MMNKWQIILSVLLATGTSFLFCGEIIGSESVQDSLAIKMVNSEIKRNPKAWMLDFSKKPKWNYCHGLELQAFMKVYEETGIEHYFDYIYQYADTMISSKGEIYTYQLEDFNIDRINAGNILFPLYRITGEERFLSAIKLLREQMKKHPRTMTGSFWHKKVYPHQVWLDGLYMATPFLAQYGAFFNEPELFDEVALQLINVHKQLYDTNTGLYYHGWDESRQQKWANLETGLSPCFWSRSIGWYMMALTDVLAFFPENHPQRKELISILRNICFSIEKYQDSESGMWYQVTDRVGEKGNYLESTGSAMFIYCWVKGGREGYLDPIYKEKGEVAYDKFIKRFFKKESDGDCSITDCCAVAGLGGSNYRDGSYEYYISEPVRDNDPKAIAPFIMASVLLEK